jgi:preprotein translocase subunit SecG
MRNRLITTVFCNQVKVPVCQAVLPGGGEAIFGKKKGVDDLLAKITGWLAALFMILTLALALI